MEQTEKREARFPIFQNRLRELQGKMSNTAFADFLGMSRQTVGFYLNGNRVPDILGLEQIARKCNVSADWLLGLTDTKAIDGELKQVCQYTGLSEDSITCLHVLYNTETGIKGSVKRLIEDIALDGERFSDLVWKSAVSELAFHQSASIKDPSPGDIALTMVKATMPENIDGFIKVPALDASSFYTNEAINHISFIASDVIKEYISSFMSELI